MNIQKRNKQILGLRNKKYTLQSIANIVGISRERVRQIAKNINGAYFSHSRVLSDLEKYLMSVRQDKGRGRARELVRLRDAHTCIDCGIVRTTLDVFTHNKKVTTLKGKWKSLDVHHTHGQCGKNSIGYDSTKNISKMITLCHKCHYNRPEHKCQSKSFGKKNPGRPKGIRTLSTVS